MGIPWDIGVSRATNHSSPVRLVEYVRRSGVVVYYAAFFMKLSTKGVAAAPVGEEG
jgi:hypothetical protein